MDVAALGAALQLDGTEEGFERARTSVNTLPNRWDFETRAFDNMSVEFSEHATGPFEANPASEADHRFVRVSAQVDVPMTFMRVIGSGPTATVRALAIGGQLPISGSREGSCPFSPYAHNDVPPDFGLIRNEIYTLRWAPSPKVNNRNTLCTGNASQAMIDLAEAGGGSERGYIEETSADVVRAAVTYDYQTVYRAIGDSVVMTGGAKQTIRDALRERIAQDTDPHAATFDEYHSNGQGYGRRLMACPVNSGAPGGYVIVQFGSFFLLPEAEYHQGGSRPFCAEFVGPYVQGSTGPGAGEDTGFYVVRLVQ